MASVLVRPARPLDGIELGFAVGLNGSPATRSLYLDWMAPGFDLLGALYADAGRRPRVALVAVARGRLVGFVGLEAHPDRGPDGIAGERTAIRLLGPVVRRDGRRAGAEVIAFLQHVARPDGHDHIEYVAVHERLRGRGYGRRFLELALAALWRDPRLRSLRLSTAEENQPPRTSALDKHLRFRY